MIRPRLVLCSGARADDYPFDSTKHIVLNLEAMGPHSNVNVRLEDVSSIVHKRLSPRLIDFLEIAAYVFTSDSATSRGRSFTDGGTTESWGREFHYVIPVRDHQFWNLPTVNRLLTQALSFLSDDKHSFTFTPLDDDRPMQEYLEFGDEWDDFPFGSLDNVTMFSGGLDSLAGAAQLASGGANLVLVSHTTSPVMGSRQKKLFKSLRATYPDVEMLHVPVWINKDGYFHQESTQRTRSFLFSALGTVVAQSISVSEVKFFENGVVSLNLPLADEVVRARASRTTHPLALAYLAKLSSLLVNGAFSITNPFIFMTKADVVQIISKVGANPLIEQTCSCPHPMFKSKTQWHCGTCSQCLDRRVAILAAGLEDFEAATDYKSDVFIGKREEGYEQNIATHYVRAAREYNSQPDEAVAVRFNAELSRAATPFPKKGEAVLEFIKMHRRHSEVVLCVVESQLSEHLKALVRGDLEPTSLLGIVGGQHHSKSTWKSYGDRISGALQDGLPKACMTIKPKNENHLQELCDGILAPLNLDLHREYPYMRWASRLTKPDWSNDDAELLVEAKYVRKSSDILGITEAIAADITKYGDSGGRVLFFVYDPYHLIADDDDFAEEIRRRPGMDVSFIR
jgi:hypothetical protein